MCPIRHATHQKSGIDRKCSDFAVVRKLLGVADDKFVRVDMATGPFGASRCTGRLTMPYLERLRSQIPPFHIHSDPDDHGDDRVPDHCCSGSRSGRRLPQRRMVRKFESVHLRPTTLSRPFFFLRRTTPVPTLMSTHTHTRPRPERHPAGHVTSAVVIERRNGRRRRRRRHRESTTTNDERRTNERTNERTKQRNNKGTTQQC